MVDPASLQEDVGQTVDQFANMMAGIMGNASAIATQQPTQEEQQQQQQQQPLQGQGGAPVPRDRSGSASAIQAAMRGRVTRRPNADPDDDPQIPEVTSTPYKP